MRADHPALKILLAAGLVTALAVGWRALGRAARRVVDDPYDLRRLPHHDTYIDTLFGRVYP